MGNANIYGNANVHGNVEYSRWSTQQAQQYQPFSCVYRLADVDVQRLVQAVVAALRSPVPVSSYADDLC